MGFCFFVILLATAALASDPSEHEKKEEENVIYLIEYCRRERDWTGQTVTWCPHDPHCNDAYNLKCNFLHAENTIENAMAVINEKNTCININKIKVFDFFGGYGPRACTPEPGFVFQKLYKLDKNAHAVKLKTVKRTVEKEIKSFVKEEQDAFAVDDNNDEVVLTVGKGIKITPGVKDLHILSSGKVVHLGQRDLLPEDLPKLQDQNNEDELLTEEVGE